MIREGKFGLREAASLMTIVLVSKAFFTSIRVLVRNTATAAWYVTLISGLITIIFFTLIYLLMKRFSGRDLVEIFEEVLGKAFGKIMALLFCLYFIYYSGTNIREFLEMIKAYVLPYTPPSFILFAFLLAVVVLAYLGLEVIVRSASSAIYFILGGLLIILVLAYPYYNLDNLFPMGGFGVARTLYHGFFRSSAYGEIVILAFIINSVHGLKTFKKAGYISIVISGIFLSACVLCSLMAFEYTQAGENLSDVFQLSRVIYFNRFFQRIESIFLFIWVVTSIITVAASFYISLSILCKAFKISNHKPLILPFSFLTFMVALLPESLSELLERNILITRQYSLFLTYGAPILVLLLAVILRKKGGRAKHEKA